MAIPVFLLLALSPTACARSAEIATPAPTYRIEVRNSLQHDVLVSYDDGSGARLLGTIPAGATERFQIADPAAFGIRITALSIDGTRSWGPFAVTLEATVPQSVTIR